MHGDLRAVSLAAHFVAAIVPPQELEAAEEEQEE
jgi:hypothetical protein